MWCFRCYVLCIIINLLNVLWINFVAAPFYVSEFPHAFYLFFTSYMFSADLVDFFQLTQEHVGIKRKLYNAFFFGVAVYGGCALIVRAVFNFDHWQLAFLDVIWGGILGCTSVFITLLLTRCL